MTATTKYRALPVSPPGEFVSKKEHAEAAEATFDSKTLKIIILIHFKHDQRWVNGIVLVTNHNECQVVCCREKILDPVVSYLKGFSASYYKKSFIKQLNKLLNEYGCVARAITKWEPTERIYHRLGIPSCPNKGCDSFMKSWESKHAPAPRWNDHTWDFRCKNSGCLTLKFGVSFKVDSL